MSAIHWSLPICLALALAACGQEESATPTADAGTATTAKDNDDAGRPPALAKGLRSPEALAVDALPRANAVRVLRLEPGTPGARPDCRTGRCIEGNLIESGLLLRDADDAGNAASVVRAWLLESDMVDVDCDPAYRQALAFNSGGSEYALLMDRDCGAYQLIVDGRISGSGFVEVPDEDPVAQALLGGAVSGDGLDTEVTDDAGEGEATDDAGEGDATGTPVDVPEGEGDAAPDEEGEEEEAAADATTVT